jgi:hypothetical protein
MPKSEADHPLLVKIPEEMILDEELPKIPGIAYLYP